MNLEKCGYLCDLAGEGGGVKHDSTAYIGVGGGGGGGRNSIKIGTERYMYAGMLHIFFVNIEMYLVTEKVIIY